MADITVGRAVGVQGTQNSDGSITANMIRVGIAAALSDKMQQMPPGQVGKALCIALSRNLTQGSRGDDVKQLQQMLAQDPSTGFTTQATGVFGPLTAKAMMMFQKNNGITPSGDGSVGPMTRALFERRCGNGLGNGQGQQGQGQNQGSGMGGMMLPKNTVIGTVSAVHGSSFTLQNRDGNKTATVNITASTTIEVGQSGSTAAHAGSIADITVGSTVMVQATQNSDGSWSASHIRVGSLPTPMNFAPMHPGQGMQGPNHGSNDSGGHENGDT
jgi:peptidoglycan hydrolase-like protein with peptidoglycan-binding domain